MVKHGVTVGTAPLQAATPPPQYRLQVIGGARQGLGALCAEKSLSVPHLGALRDT